MANYEGFKFPAPAAKMPLEPIPKNSRPENPQQSFKKDPNSPFAKFTTRIMVDEVGVFPLFDISPETKPKRAKKSCKKQQLNEYKEVELKPFEGLFDYLIFSKKLRRLPDGEDYFNKLPDEVMLSIFSMLEKPVIRCCARVCQRWRALSCDESLWKNINASKKTLLKGAFGTLLQRGVVTLKLADAQVITPLFRHLPWNVIRFSKLQNLDLTMASVSTQNLSMMFFYCNGLRKVSLENCALNDGVCQNLAQNHNLEELNMCRCSGLGALGIFDLLTNCTKLKALNVAWAKVGADVVQALTLAIPHGIRYFSIGGCYELQDDDLLAMLKRCPGLIRLDISDCSFLTDRAIHHIVEHSCIGHLSCSRLYQVTPSTYTHLKNMKGLKKVDIFYTLIESELNDLKKCLSPIEMNQQMFSHIARPTTGKKVSRIWGNPLKAI